MQMHRYTLGEMADSTDSAIDLLREQGMRMTPQRIAIVTEIMTTPGYVIPMHFIKRIQAQVPGVSPSTVYRTLERLEQVGVLVHVHLESGIGYHRLDDVQHVHLTCAGCGHHAISGLCAHCRRAQRPSPAAAHAHRS